MDAIKTIDTLKPYTQRRLYFRSDLEEGNHQFHYPLQDIIDFICTSWNIDGNPQPPAAKKCPKRKLEEAIEEIKKIHVKWKANKRNMRLEHFDENKTDAQNRASCPNEVIDTQRKKSKNGKASRKHLSVPHHGGTKSFVNHAIETTQKKASLAVVYRKTYRAREGKTSNPKAEANHAQIEALEREDLEENGSDNDVSILELTSYGQLKGDKYSKSWELRNLVGFVVLVRN
ncbi:hypothetical protein C5167_002750 [Papaver somniferum]|uniref:Uncharacterized protein n=1 Tax=Papaver somniferum TaxID=3469 RepID=A0A4Y7L2H0_PAPSO|nr:hypothetical protein C5167_002750 [Papaver somniferum]